jgi:hypothetical protein
MTNLVNCEPVSVEEVRSVNHTRYPDLSEFSHFHNLEFRSMSKVHGGSESTVRL